jgi:hypothetical protein
LATISSAVWAQQVVTAKKAASIKNDGFLNVFM